MLKNIFDQTVWICGTVCFSALTLVLLKLVYDFLRGRLYTTQTHVWLNRTEPVTTSSISVSAPTTRAVPLPEPEPSPTPPPKPPPRLQPEMPADFVLLCGACRKSIKSQATRVHSANGKTEMRYQCEHCGALVEVKI